MDKFLYHKPRALSKENCLDIIDYFDRNNYFNIYCPFMCLRIETIQNKIQICFYEVVVGCLHAPRIFVRSTHVFNLPIARNLRYTFRIGTYVSSTCSTIFYMDAKELF